MWTHNCEVEKTEISNEDGEPCNWCDAEPEQPEAPRLYLVPKLRVTDNG